MKKSESKKKMSKTFQKLKAGDKVSVSIEASENTNFPRRLLGSTGVVEGKRGKAYILKIKDTGREKEFVVKAVHIKKLS